MTLADQLKSLSDAHKQTVNLIQELQRFPNSAVFAQNADEKRVEIANEIHQNLREKEEILELLQQDIDRDVTSQASRQISSAENERERNAFTASRLNEEIKNARSDFRRAQLQAKRNADNAKRKEREQLFAGRTLETSAPRRRGQEKLTQDDLALNAAEDVTRSLKRAHDLLTGNLQQSQFAQQTLDQSSEALKGLTESYSGTTDLLKNSRGLVSSLIRSQKSDTWFLISSTYILAGTIAWLIFRRLLYGPLWWLVWQPLKLMWWATFASLGAAGFGQGSVLDSGTTGLSVSSQPPPTPVVAPQFRSVQLPAKGAGWGGPTQPKVPDTPTMVDEVGSMAEESAQSANRWEGQRESPEAARNTKKRMMDINDGRERLKDEL